MSDHFEKTLADARAEIAKDEDRLRVRKRSLNELCAMMGKPIAYPGIEDETTTQVGAPLKGDEYFAQVQHSACRAILARRKALDAGPATPDELYADLLAGGYRFDTENEDNRKRGLRQMLAQNTAVFIKLPNGKFGLRDWYPSLRKPEDTESAKPRVRRERLSEPSAASPDSGDEA